MCDVATSSVPLVVRVYIVFSIVIFNDLSRGIFSDTTVMQR